MKKQHTRIRKRIFLTLCPKQKNFPWHEPPEPRRRPACVSATQCVSPRDCRISDYMRIDTVEGYISTHPEERTEHARVLGATPSTQQALSRKSPKKSRRPPTTSSQDPGDPRPETTRTSRTNCDASCSPCVSSHSLPWLSSRGAPRACRPRFPQARVEVNFCKRCKPRYRPTD